MKLTFAVNVPVKGQRYTIKERGEGAWVPHIYHRDLYFTLCDICGSQITDRRRSHTCSNQCTEEYWRRICETERHENCRPFFWNTFRDEVLKRDGHRCTRCGSMDGLEVHHIVPVHVGGTNAPENLTTLCHECHAALHAEERRQEAEERRRAKEGGAKAAVVERHGGKTIEDWCA